MTAETRYTVIQAIAVVAACALVGVSFMWGRVSAGHQRPEVYVVHDTELSTTTTSAP